MECPECGMPQPVIRRPANRRQMLWGGWTCAECGTEIDRFGRSVGPARPSFASDPGGLTVSPEKLRVLRPDLYGFAGMLHRLRVKVGLAWDQMEYLGLHLANGDCRAAVVVSVDPLLVAAYTDELDGVAILEFPDEFVEDYGLRDGTRLLTVNTYTRLREPDDDVVFGPSYTGGWNGFNPIIADFVSDDAERIDEAKDGIDEEEWQLTYSLGRAYLNERPGVARDGRPIHSGVSAYTRPNA